MRDFDYNKAPEKLLTSEIVQMIGSIHEHKGKQELFLEANIDELKTLLEVALIQSTGASNRIEGIFTATIAAISASVIKAIRLFLFTSFFSFWLNIVFLIPSFVKLILFIIYFLCFFSM